jgi:uncharacterized membrane protein
MSLGNLGWDVVLAVHILCITLWVGGMFFAFAVLHPALAGLEGAPRVALMGRVLKRFFLVMWHVIPLVLLSGYAMQFGVFGGFAGANWSIDTMQGIGVIMAAIFVALFTGPWRSFRIAIQPARAAKAGGAIRRLVVINLALGIITIVVAALVHWPW